MYRPFCCAGSSQYYVICSIEGVNICSDFSTANFVPSFGLFPLKLLEIFPQMNLHFPPEILMQKEETCIF